MVKQVGHAVLTVKLPDESEEEYLITLPKLRIDGIWYGSPYIELIENSYIQSSTGFLSTIEYKGKGYFSGKAHSYKAVLSIGGNPKETFEGQWDTTSKHTKTGKAFHDVSGAKEEVTVRSLDGQEEFESRRLWREVAKGIREGDYETAAREKTKIENDQRQRRKDEQTAGIKWPLKHFVHVESDPTYVQLGALFKAIPPTEDVYTYMNNGPTFS
jgi:hypothetical protein